MTGIEEFELVLGLLTVAVLFSALAPALRMPPATAFVLGGMALALVPGTPSIDLDADLVLVLFLPPLLMSSAINTVWRDFRAQFGPILMLAVGAVVFTTATVGCMTKLIVPDLPWAACFTLGAIVSPPDAVAAKAVLTRLPLPRRLVTVLEGESLINDASGLLLYRVAAAAALSGTFSPGWAAASFVLLSAGGVAIGAAAGYLADLAFRRMHDSHHVIIITFLLTFGSYVAAERLHVSGVLAVVCCGLIVSYRQHATLSAQVRLQTIAVWEVVTFALEALVFVLIGLSLRGVVERLGVGEAALHIFLPLTVAVTAVVIVSRFLLVFISAYSVRLLPRQRHTARVPASMPLLLSWAGMRGVVSLAAALALPAGFPGRDAILLATFGVILVTVLLQGTTLGLLARWLHVTETDEELTPASATLSTAAARAHVFKAALEWLEALDEPGAEPPDSMLIDEYRRRADITSRFLVDQEAVQPPLGAHFKTALAAMAQRRAAVLKLHRQRKIHDRALHAIEGELDLEELLLRRLAGLEPRGH